MMKSFFKKLAFVMALAMVVSMAAPAAVTASAAEFVVADRATWATKTEANVEVGGKLAFRFKGAPTGWDKLGFAWSSSDEEVATVDSMGYVTGVKDGVATITIQDAAKEYVASVKVTVGAGEVVEVPEVKEAVVAEVVADNKVQLTFADVTVNAAALKGKLAFKQYVAANRAITLQLIKSIKDVEAGVVEVELYTTLQDGKSYSLVYGDIEAPFDFVLGTVTNVMFTIKDDTDYVVEADENKAYTFVPVLFNEKGVDITATAMKAQGAYVEYTLSEGNAYWAVPDGIQFSDAAEAYVTITYYALNKDNETVAVGTPWNGVVVAVAPEPWAIDFDDTPVYTIATSVNWEDLKANTKLAVGDFKDLYVSVTDNKGKEVRTNVGHEKGYFTFESTNDEILYVTENGTLMPNKTGTVDVLVWFTTNGDTPATTLATVITIKVEPARGVKTFDVKPEKNTLSTSTAVTGANSTKVSVTVVDTLGVAEGVAGKTATIEKTTTTPNGLVAPSIKAIETATDKVTATVGADGKFEFTIEADAKSAVEGSYATYSYKVTIDSVVKTFSVTVRAPKANVTSYKVLIDGDTDLAVNTDDNQTADQVFTVSLIGLNNGVANKAISFTGKKTGTATAAEKDLFYYEVKKGADDITDKVIPNNDGSISIAITKEDTKADFKKTAKATAEALTYVKDESGSGNYAVTVWTVKYNADTKTYYWSKVSTTNQNVADTEVKVSSSVEKLAPTYAIADPKAATPDEVIAAVKACFKFKVGNVELKPVTEGDDPYNNYMIQVSENLVPNGDVCYVKSVTVYRHIGGGVYVNCGTIDVNSTIEFTQAQ